MRFALSLLSMFHISFVHATSAQNPGIVQEAMQFNMQPRTVEEGLSRLKPTIDKKDYEFLALKVKGLEKKMMPTVSMVRENIYTMAIDGMLISLDATDAAQGKWKVNQKTVSFLEGKIEERWDKLMAALPLMQSSVFDLIVPKAEADFGTSAIIGFAIFGAAMIVASRVVCSRDRKSYDDCLQSLAFARAMNPATMQPKEIEDVKASALKKIKSAHGFKDHSLHFEHCDYGVAIFMCGDEYAAILKKKFKWNLEKDPVNGEPAKPISQ